MSATAATVEKAECHGKQGCYHPAMGRVQKHVQSSFRGARPATDRMLPELFGFDEGVEDADAQLARVVRRPA